MQNQPFQSKHSSQPGLAPAPLTVKPLLGLAGAMVLGAIALTTDADAASLTNWRYDTAANQLEVTVDAATTPRYFLMAQPARIVLDLPDTEVGDVKVREAYSGAVRQIRVSQFQPGLTRIVLELSPNVTLAPEQVKLEKVKKGGQEGRDRWILRPLIAKASAKVSSDVKVPVPPAVTPSAVKKPALPTSTKTKPPQDATSVKSPAKSTTSISTAPTVSKPIKPEPSPQTEAAKPEKVKPGVSKSETEPPLTSAPAKPPAKPTSLVRTAPTASKLPKPESSSKPEAAKPEAAKPESKPLQDSTSTKPLAKLAAPIKATPTVSPPSKPESAAKPEAVKPEVTQSAAIKPGTVTLETVKPEVAKSAADKPGVIKPEAAKTPSQAVPSDRAVLPPASVGSDVSPVTHVTTKISVPSLLPPSGSQSTVSVQPATPPQTVPSQTAPPQTIAQSLPAETTTPLPPDASQPATGLAIDTSNGIRIAVPPPVSLPNKPADVVVKSPVITPLPPIAPQLSGSPPQAISVIPSSNPPRTKTPVSNPGLSTVPSTVAAIGSAEMPSTIKVIPSTTPNVSVPPLVPLETAPMGSAVVPARTAIPAIAPQPALVQNSTVNRAEGLQPPVSSVIQAPVSSVMQPSTPNTMQPPTSSVIQPPVSSAMQPPVSSVIQQPPASSVFQPPASGVARPPISSVMQPPVSSVMQSPAASGIQSSTALPSSALPDISTSQPPMVSVPSLPLNPPAISDGQLPTVGVPPLQPMLTQPPIGATLPGSPPAAPLPANTANTSFVEFGKPLPTNGAMALNTAPKSVPGYPLAAGQAFQSPYADVLLPTGTMLNLSYPGTVELKLEAGIPRQEVLLLQTEVRDATGNVVLPQGSYVTGRFETDRTGSKFVAQSIALRDRTIPLSAQSESLGGNRELSSTSMLLYSGIGALAGGLVSGFSGLGLFGGAAAGATANYFISPKPAAIQPGQVLQIRVLQDLR